MPALQDLPAGSIISSKFSDDRRFDVKNGMKPLLSESSSLVAMVAVNPMDYTHVQNSQCLMKLENDTENKETYSFVHPPLHHGIKSYERPAEDKEHI